MKFVVAFIISLMTVTSAHAWEFWQEHQYCAMHKNLSDDIEMSIDNAGKERKWLYKLNLIGFNNSPLNIENGKHYSNAITFYYSNGKEVYYRTTTNKGWFVGVADNMLAGHLSEEFMEHVAAANSVSFTIDGIYVGTVSLAGSRKAVTELRRCMYSTR